MSIEYSFSDKFPTDYTGYDKLITFYNEVSQYKSETIFIDIKSLKWFDANLCALLMAIIYKLQKDNKLVFIMDTTILKTRFDILLRNQFISIEGFEIDNRKTTIPYRSFLANDKESFKNYLENDFSPHRGLSLIKKEILDNIKESITEIYLNTHLHAKTIDPFFICGQYFPTNKILKLTMVDLGEGFLPTINRFTGIENAIDAIHWALKGNSVKFFESKTPGGLGISQMYKYFYNTPGTFEIITGGAYFSTNYQFFDEKSYVKVPQFCGTTINLIFSNN